MNDILNKISSYNLLNYLLPGAVFSVVAELFGLIPAPTEIVEKLIWFYFVGMVISRLGSLILEPLLKKMAFVRLQTHNQNMTVAARAMADKKTLGHLS